MAWRVSDYLTYPGTPDSLRRGLAGTPEAPYCDHWLEGNIVPAGDRMRVYWRIRIDGQTTPGICAVCELRDDGMRLDYRFTQFYPLPGAQNHFHIIRDDESSLYWMTSKLPTRSQDREFNKKLYGGERRIMMLHFSFDGLDWLPAGYLTVWPRLRQSSNYSTPLIDGDDLLIASRTSRSGPTPHDNDLVTLHRVRNFRELSRALLPAGE